MYSTQILLPHCIFSWIDVFVILTLDWYGLPFCLCRKTWATHLIPALRLLCCVLLCMESSAPDASRKIESILFLQYTKA